MRSRLACLVLTLSAAALALNARADDKPAVPATGTELGAFKIAGHAARASFKEGDSGYQLTLEATWPASEGQAAIDSARIDAWLLAPGGKSVVASTKPAAGNLPATSPSGACGVQAVYTFPKASDKPVAVVVAFDGEPVVWKTPAAAGAAAQPGKDAGSPDTGPGPHRLK